MVKKAFLAVGDTIEIEVEALAPSGAGTGRYRTGEGVMAVLVPYTAPGDLVFCRIIRIHRGYAEAELLELRRSSEHRLNPVCPHFYECGCCSLMHIDYPKQLEFKADAANSTLRTAGLGVAQEVIAPCEPLRYRSRAEIQCMLLPGGGVRAGYLTKHSYKVVQLTECKTLKVPCENALKMLPNMIRQCLPSPFPLSEDFYFKTAIFWEYPCDSAIVWLRLKRKYLGDAPRLYRFHGQLIEPIQGAEPLFKFPSANLDLHAHPNSFTQVNWEGNRCLVEEVFKIASEIKPKRVLELHAGVGNFTVHLARLAEHVTAVEKGKTEANLLRTNLDMLGITNVSIKRVSDEWMLDRIAKTKAAFDLVVCDPPRRGIGQNAAERLALAAPEHIIYVSCNPSSLTHDLKMLIPKYRPRTLKLIDLFPQTPHIESIAWLSAKGF